jgi:hypothetical protein
MMKKIFYLILMGLIGACSVVNKSALQPNEDQLVVTRKYMGDFIDYRHTGMETMSGPNIIWIKTSLDSTYGKISAYGKKCDFSDGERLYLRRVYYSPGGLTGYWEYRIENDSSLYYRVTDFQHDRRILVRDWF